MPRPCWRLTDPPGSLALRQTTASPSRFLLADHLFSTAASLPAFKLPAPFAGPQTDAKGKGRAADGDADDAPADEGEVDDVLFVGALPAVDRWLARVCDVKGASCSARPLSPSPRCAR